jgi:hypothetical protein
MATMESSREVVPHAKRMTSCIFNSIEFEFFCAEKIETGHGGADPILAFKSKTTVTPPGCSIGRRIGMHAPALQGEKPALARPGRCALALLSHPPP